MYVIKYKLGELSQSVVVEETAWWLLMVWCLYSTMTPKTIMMAKDSLCVPGVSQILTHWPPGDCNLILGM